MTDTSTPTGLTDAEAQLKLLLMLAGVVATLMMKMHQHKIPGGDLGEDFIQCAGPFVQQLDPETFARDADDPEMIAAKKELLKLILGALDPSEEALKRPN